MDTSRIVDLPVSTRRRAISDLPGPRGWPLLGNLMQLDVPRLHLQLEAWAKEHGSMYRLRFGNRDVVVVSSSDLIAGIMRDRPTGWRRMRLMQTVINEAGGTGLFSAEGDDWRRQRRLVMAAFDPGHLKRYFASLVRVTERLRRRLDAAAQSGEVVDLQTVLMRYTVDVAAGLAFGFDINTQEHPDNPLQEHLSKLFPMLMRRINSPLPWWHYFKLPSDRDYDRSLVKIHEAVEGFVRAARERMELDPVLREQPTNLLEAMIAARDEDGGALTEQDLLGNVLTILLAGEDTTANTLGWMLHLLYTHRAAWDEVVAEVDLALGLDLLPRKFDVARGLDIIEQCASEAMRLRPVAPLFYFENNNEKTLDDLTLPADTFVICVTRSGAVDPSLAPDAAKFRPGRWRGAVPAVASAGKPSTEVASALAMLKASTPFGAGPRLCPGRYLAILEMKMVIATIARNFELIEVTTKDGSPPVERLAFTMFPPNLRMRLRSRTPK